MKAIVTILFSVFLVSCATPGTGSAAATVTPQAQGAQTVGGDQGQASAAETGSANTQSNPIIINALAAKKVVVEIEPGRNTNVTVDAAEDSEVHVKGGEWGLMKWGNNNTLSSETSSGGGAAGGVGGASRGGTESSVSNTNTGARGVVPATPATPPTPDTPDTP